MKSSNIGGQAVLEGIMMRNGGKYSVAVRKSDGEIAVDVQDYHSVIPWNTPLKIPFIRGIFSFIDSLVLGMKTLMYSASFFEEEEEEILTEKEAAKQEKQEKLFMTLTVILAVVIAIALFMVLPYFLSSFVEKYTRSHTAMTIFEGVIRVAIFLVYIFLISRTKDIRRTFMYHGAEHKCINCIEHGMELTVENVRKSSKQHKRCGTSFLIFVMLISILLFMVIRVDNVWLRILSRIILIPVIAGVSYEVLRLAGTSNSKIMDIISRPGLWMQGLTTKEPDDSMIEVAIAAVEQVFDWKSYLEENFPEQYPKGYFEGHETDGQECRAGGKGCKESGGQESGR